MQEKRNILLKSLVAYLQNLNIEHHTSIDESNLNFDIVFKEVQSSMDFISISRLNNYIEKLNEGKKTAV